MSKTQASNRPKIETLTDRELERQEQKQAVHFDLISQGFGEFQRQYDDYRLAMEQAATWLMTIRMEMERRKQS